MAFDVTDTGSGSVVVNERLYLTSDRKTVVAEGDPGAAFLLATPGKTLSREQAVALGLVKERKQPVADKQRKKPASK